MPERNGTPDWCVPGAEAVLISIGTGLAKPTHEEVTVERVLKRDVVLSNDERVTQPTLTRQDGGSWTGRTYRLVLPEDERAVSIRRELAARAVISKVDSICHRTQQDLRALNPNTVSRTDLYKRVLSVATDLLDVASQIKPVVETPEQEQAS